MVLVVLGVCLVTLTGALLELSSEKHAAFASTIPTQKSSPADFLPVNVRLSRGAIGQTTTIVVKHGGQAATTASSNVSAGFVGFRKAATSPKSTQGAETHNTSTGRFAGSPRRSPPK
jgi:hypothetical protein